VCALQGAVNCEETGSLPDVSSELRFEHYQVLKNEDGTPMELGHGGMGLTYKAIDVNLRCAVALKVINARLIGDGSARRRFVREARASASVRHPNVASVFHLGKSGNTYFYTMEFVEGETLQSLIKHSVRLDLRLALEIAKQVTAGLAAIYEQDLIHRDIKPSNVMVNLREGVSSVAKIIDLGLAKAANESASEAGISTPGAFAGTPEFASPEQFAGVGVDIRSDLYSLGIVLWQMLTGSVPFNGSVNEVMYQHLHTPPPVKLLKNAPQPVIVLLEMLLAKDPIQRFQTPNELLNALGTVNRAAEAKRTIKHQDLRVSLVDRPSSRQEKPAAIRAPKRSIAVLPFDSLSAAKGNTYFADGVQDEILSNLAKISQLKVISRTSVMGFRRGDNRNLRSIAESLGVRNVVEGTVRRDGKRVRIIIRLVDARSDKALWSGSYDRDLQDIFAVQSEIAQVVASKLSARLSPEEKKSIEAKPTENLEAYDLYLRANELILRSGATGIIGNVAQPLKEAISLLKQAVRIDPNFTLAFSAIAKASAEIYHFDDRSLEQRALADAAMNNALRLKPDLSEVHLAYAYYLYWIYRDYERARVQLAMARRGLPNNVSVNALTALMYRRQGKWDKGMECFEEAIVRDPLNPESMAELGNTLYFTRQFRAAAQMYDRLIELLPHQPMLKVEKAWLVTFCERGDYTPLRVALAELPTSIANDTGVLSWRLRLALFGRDWEQAEELIEKMAGGEDDGNFAYVNMPVPVGCYAILLARLQGKLENACFAQTRDQLNRKVQSSPGNALLLSKLGLVDSLLDNKERAISEAKRAVELLPISRDAVDGPQILINLAAVYAWTNEADLAFEILGSLTKTPNGVYYGDLKLPYWDPLRQDPRFDKLLAELAPRD
jgi:serine/threonine protein kinase